MNFEIHNPQAQLLSELQFPGITQASVAITYAYVIAQEGDAADWRALNDAIRRRWKGKSALARIKEMAWRHVDRGLPGY